MATRRRACLWRLDFGLDIGRNAFVFVFVFAIGNAG